MDSFDIEDVKLWEGEKVAGAPANPAESAPGAWPPERPAPGRRGLPHRRPPAAPPPSAPSATRTQPTDRPCTSFEDIYKTYQGLVWRKLRRRDIDHASAEELHQEVFLILNTRIQKRELIDNVPAMLRKITTHQICNHLRRRRRNPELTGVELDEMPESRLDVEQRMDRAGDQRLVEAVLAELPEGAAGLIREIDLAELTQAEVAEQLRRPLSTVKTQHQRARERFGEVAKRLRKRAASGGGSSPGSILRAAGDDRATDLPRSSQEPRSGLQAALSGAARHEVVASEGPLAGVALTDRGVEPVKEPAASRRDANGGAAEPAADVAAAAAPAAVTTVQHAMKCRDASETARAESAPRRSASQRRSGRARLAPGELRALRTDGRSPRVVRRAGRAREAPLRIAPHTQYARRRSRHLSARAPPETRGRTGSGYSCEMARAGRIGWH